MFKWATQAEEKGRGKRKGGSVCWSHVQLNSLAPLYAAVHTFYSWDSQCWNRKLTNTLKHSGNGSANWSSWKVQLLAKTWPTTPIRPCPPWKNFNTHKKTTLVICSERLLFCARLLCEASRAAGWDGIDKGWRRTFACLTTHADWVCVFVCVGAKKTLSILFLSFHFSIDLLSDILRNVLPKIYHLINFPALRRVLFTQF